LCGRADPSETETVSLCLTGNLTPAQQGKSNLTFIILKIVILTPQNFFNTYNI